MIQPGEKFTVNEINLEAVASTREAGCEGCTFNSEVIGCMDPNHDSDCYDLMKGEYVIFKEVTK